MKFNSAIVHVTVLVIAVGLLALTYAIDPKQIKALDSELIAFAESTKLASRSDRVKVSNVTKNKSCFTASVSSMASVSITQQALVAIKLACDYTTTKSPEKK